MCIVIILLLHPTFTKLKVVGSHPDVIQVVQVLRQQSKP